MKVDIDIGSSDAASNCRFDHICMKDFESSLCCDIVGEEEYFLLVRPVSTFKSANCSYRRRVEHEGREVDICTCPVRMLIYRKTGV
ncbi:MAG: hypothetical protein Kow0089_22080 [Desulfobulbaceae bacterium]